LLCHCRSSQSGIPRSPNFARKIPEMHRSKPMMNPMTKLKTKFRSKKPVSQIAHAGIACVHSREGRDRMPSNPWNRINGMQDTSIVLRSILLQAMESIRR